MKTTFFEASRLRLPFIAGTAAINGIVVDVQIPRALGQEVMDELVDIGGALQNVESTALTCPLGRFAECVEIDLSLEEDVEERR